MSKLGYFDSVLTDKGVPLLATITVFDQGTATPSTIYADAGGVTPLANPFSTDAIGRFQFYAATGKYDVQVSGAGITTYKIENVSLSGISLISELMDVTTYFCVTPEQYGAVGDGLTDDYAAFLAMFAALAISTAPRKKIILNPAVYYSIQSRTDATNVFLIDVDNLIMEGPGMGVKTIAYEGALTATNFMKFINQPGYNDFHDLKIKCGAGDDSDTRDLSKITNIICWDDTKYTSLAHLELDGCTGACVTGFNWMSEVRHCNLKWAGVGLDEIATTAFVANCYANVCLIGFKIGGTYGTYISNACDHAEIAYYLNSPTNVSLVGNGSEHCDQAVYGPCAASTGNVQIIGLCGNGNAEVDKIRVGAFPAAWIELVDVAGVILDVQDRGDIYNTYLMKLTTCENLTINGKFEKSRIYVTDYVPGETWRRPAILGNEIGWAGYYARYIDAADFLTIVGGTLNNYTGCRDAVAMIRAGTIAIASTIVYEGLKGQGTFTIEQDSSGAGTTQLNFATGATPGLQIRNVNIPLNFDNRGNPATNFFIFHQAGSGALIELYNCDSKVRFDNITFDGHAGTGAVFNIDEFSNLELDKTTMDRITGTFTALCNRPEKIKFTGYTAKPIAGFFDTGCRIEFMAPAAGGYLGCICTAGGSPGTWKYYGAIEA